MRIKDSYIVTVCMSTERLDTADQLQLQLYVCQCCNFIAAVQLCLCVLNSSHSFWLLQVSMHITLSGPYETLYTTAVDMWSFGCLCLNICIGKTAALSQREVILLLLNYISGSYNLHSHTGGFFTAIYHSPLWYGVVDKNNQSKY